MITECTSVVYVMAIKKKTVLIFAVPSYCAHRRRSVSMIGGNIVLGMGDAGSLVGSTGGALVGGPRR